MIQLLLFSLKCVQVCNDCFYFPLLLVLDVNWIDLFFFFSHQFKEILSYKVCKRTGGKMFMCSFLHLTYQLLSTEYRLSYNCKEGHVLREMFIISVGVIVFSLHHPFLKAFSSIKLNSFSTKKPCFFRMCKWAIPRVLQHVSAKNYRIPIFLGVKYNCSNKHQIPTSNICLKHWTW